MKVITESFLASMVKSVHGVKMVVQNALTYINVKCVKEDFIWLTIKEIWIVNHVKKDVINVNQDQLNALNVLKATMLVNIMNKH